MNDYINRFLR